MANLPPSVRPLAVRLSAAMAFKMGTPAQRKDRDFVASVQRELCEAIEGIMDDDRVVVVRRAADMEAATGKVRKADPRTSKLAAWDQMPHWRTQRYRVFVAVFEAGPDGLNASEVERALDIPTSSASKRVGELVAGGWLMVADGVTRPTSRGLQGQVYVATGRAQRELATNPDVDDRAWAAAQAA